MVGHRVGMAVREDHQVAFTKQYRPIKSFYSEPAHSSSDDMEAGNLSGGHTKAPGCAHLRAAVEGTFQMYRLEQVGKNIFLKTSEGFHRNSSLNWTIGKEL